MTLRKCNLWLIIILNGVLRQQAGHQLNYHQSGNIASGLFTFQTRIALGLLKHLLKKRPFIEPFLKIRFYIR